MLGSLSALSALESEATSLEKKEAEAKQRSQEHQEQLERIRELKQRRDQLLQRLHDKADSEASRRDDDLEMRGGGDEDDERISALSYISELKEKLQVYKMTGVSVVKTGQDSKVMSFSTSHQGHFMESYHLQLTRLPSGHFKIVHHDLPPFVANPGLPASLEVKDVSQAVRPIQEALAMFVARREELKRVQRDLPDTFHVVESSAARDYLCCHLSVRYDDDDAEQQQLVEITLAYTDLNHYLPSSATAVLLVERGGRIVKESLGPAVLERVQSELCSQALGQALVRTTLLLQDYLPHHSAETS